MIGCFWTSMFGQAPVQPAFEVASIKLSPPPDGGRAFSGIRGGPGSDDPLHATFTRMRLGGIISYAYDLKPYEFDQTDPRYRLDDFDISVTIPENTTREQFRLMLRTLLAERFHLRIHREKKSADVFDLVQARGGHKLHPPTTPGEPKPMGTFEKDEENLPKLPPGVSTQVCAFGGCRLQQIGTTLSFLVLILSADLRAPVIDATGLAGQKFDYSVGYGPSDATPNRPLDAPPPLATAINDQLGLRLERRKGEVDVLIVDSVDRQPTEN
jgi:uncharacterized protein (TIGR03435 family)